MPADFQHLLDDHVARARPRPGLLVVAATDGNDIAFASRGPLPGTSTAPERAIFEIGSITKAFTSLLLAVAVGRGEVGLDDRVVDHLPAETRVPMRDGRPIRLVDLATHRSGLPRLPPGLLLDALRHRDDPYARLTIDDALAALGRTHPRRPAGERFRYSNFGAGLLGIALANAAGTDYGTLVRERITSPLGLSDTVIELDEDQRRRVVGGTKRFGRAATPWTFSGLAGAGAIRSTATDLLTFVRAQMGTLEGIPEDLAAAIHLSHQERTASGRLTPRMRVALGWFSVGIGGRKLRVMMHDGGTGGYRSIVGWARAAGYGVVVLSANVQSVDRIGADLVLALSAPERH